MQTVEDLENCIEEICRSLSSIRPLFAIEEYRLIIACKELLRDKVQAVKDYLAAEDRTIVALVKYEGKK